MAGLNRAAIGCASLALVLFVSSSGWADVNAGEHSLWELGLAAAGAYMPDYPAAAQNRGKWIVAPYGVYRGRIVRADREGARARLVHTKLYEMDLSIAASFASRAKDNDARQGMPDLDYLFELGPRLTFGISELGGRGKLMLFVPVRAVFSTDLGDLQHRGYSAAPALHARYLLSRQKNIMGILQLTSTFGNRQLNSYFYDVAPAFIRADRSFYDARGGYMGSDLFAGLLIPLGKRLRFFSGGQLLNHSGSANQVSPLFKNHINYSVAMGVVCTLWRSKSPAVNLD